MTQLAARLMKVLEDSDDPRLNDAFDGTPWVSPTAPASQPNPLHPAPPAL